MRERDERTGGWTEKKLKKMNRVNKGEGVSRIQNWDMLQFNEGRNMPFTLLSEWSDSL